MKDNWVFTLVGSAVLGGTAVDGTCSRAVRLDTLSFSNLLSFSSIVSTMIESIKYNISQQRTYNSSSMHHLHPKMKERPNSSDEIRWFISIYFCFWLTSDGCCAWEISNGNLISTDGFFEFIASSFEIFHFSFAFF